MLRLILAAVTACALAAPAQAQSLAVRTDQPPAEIAALGMPSGPLDAASVTLDGAGVVLAENLQKRITGAAGAPTIEVTYLQIYSDGPRAGATYRVVRSRLDCAALTARDIGSRFFAEDGAPVGWLPAGGFFPAADRGSVALMLTQVCSGAPPLRRFKSPEEALADARQVAASFRQAAANPLPLGPIAVQTGKTDFVMVVLSGQARNGSAVDLWTLMVRPEGQAADEGASTIVRRIHLDCAAMTVRTVGGTGYDGAGIPRIIVGANPASTAIARDGYWAPLVTLACDGAPPMRTVIGYREARALVLPPKAPEPSN